MNVTCIPGIGVFTFHFDKKNYSEAKSKCEEDGGQLAVVLSEQRTNLLAISLFHQSLPQKKTQAYIGLDDSENEGTYVSSDGLFKNIWPFCISCIVIYKSDTPYVLY